MQFQAELDGLYKKALELKTQGMQTVRLPTCLELKAAGILQKTFKNKAEQNPEDPATAAILLYLAEREWAILGDHEQVLSRIERALALREKSLGARHALTAEALAQLAEFHFLSGRFGEAEPLYQRALSFMQSMEKTQILSVPKAFEGLAHTLSALGRPPRRRMPIFRTLIDQ